MNPSSDPVPRKVPGAPGRRGLWAGVGLLLLAVGLLLIPDWPDFVRGGTQDEAAPRPVALTRLAGDEVEAALSPDGKQLAFAWRQRPGERSDIYTRSIEGQSLQRVTDDPADDRRPVWSPDGSQLAFLRRTAGRCEVRLVSLPGVASAGKTRRAAVCNPLADDNLAWMPNGQSLIFTAPGSRGLARLKLGKGTVNPITRPPAGALGDSDPAVSPDGSQLAFVRWRALGAGDLFVARIGAGAAHRLSFDSLDVRGAAWEPDGRHLLYSSNRGGGFALWRLNADGDAPQHVPLAARSAEAPVISRDGRRLIYEAWRGQANLFVLDAAAPGTPPRALTATTRRDWNPQVSPDGKRLAFVSDRGGSAEIWTSARDGSGATRLTGFGSPYTGSPTWSPDDRGIVFETSAVEGNFDIFTVNAAGGAPLRVTADPADDRFAHYSPDGNYIYFSSRRSGDWEIWRMRAGGGPEQRLTRGGAYFGFPAGDGALYFARNDQRGIWRIGRDGGAAVQVVTDLQPLDCTNWTLREQRLWYVQRNAGGEPFLALHDLTTRSGRRLRALPQLMYKSGLSVGLDGSAYYARVVRSETDLVMIERP